VQEKQVLVFTDERPQPYILTVRVIVPAWADASPRLLWWSVGEEAFPKEAVLTLNASADIRISAVRSDSVAMSVNLRPGSKLGSYRLVVRPESTKIPVQAVVSIDLELAGASPRTFTFFAQVR
jgi:hypothetical protein